MSRVSYHRTNTRYFQDMHPLIHYVCGKLREYENSVDYYCIWKALNLTLPILEHRFCLHAWVFYSKSTLQTGVPHRTILKTQEPHFCLIFIFSPRSQTFYLLFEYAP
jgi:hypothetical protein